jgi:uncharacterized membrane protein YjgN (DUF898 family)
MNSTPPELSSVSQRPSFHLFEFDGSAPQLFMLFLKNLILTVATLGLYYPWARTRLREFMWHHTKLDEMRFQYTGTGQELAKGYVKVLLIYAAWLLINRLTGDHSLLPWLSLLMLVAVFFWLIPLATFYGHRYRMSRTRYRGLHFNVDSDLLRKYQITHATTLLLSFLTLGLLLPVCNHRNYAGLVRATSFGNRKFHYSGKDGEYAFVVFTNIVLIICTLGLFWPWAILRKERYKIEHTTFDQASFELNLRGFELISIALLQIFVLPLTLGLALPWIEVFTMRKLLSGLMLEGNIDFSSITAAPRADNDATGDSMLNLLSLDTL